eukprot:1609550-Rhodomonas_salina.1
MALRCSPYYKLIERFPDDGCKMKPHKDCRVASFIMQTTFNHGQFILIGPQCNQPTSSNQ